MFILSILYYGYDKFVDLLMKDEKDKKYTDKDVIIKMIVFGIILFLSIISAYYIPYILLVLMSMSK
jgi:hypothetical protein